MKKKFIRKFIPLFILYAIAICAPSGELFANKLSKVYEDDSEIVEKHFSEEELRQHINDRDFQYNVSEVKDPNWWERLKNYFIYLLRSLLNSNSFGPALTIFMYITCAAMIIYVIMKLMNIEIMKIFGKKENVSGSFSYQLHDENIHEINFEEELRKAVKDENYRLAVRLYYLLALKTLSEQGCINWKPGKTNSEYLVELHNDQVKSLFVELNKYFEYAWYGNFEIKQQSYSKVKKTFQSMKEEIVGVV
jgi:hypothetical protein